MTTLDFDLNIRLGAFELSAATRIPLQGVTVLYGHSGSGKSTLLRIIAGLEKKAEGFVKFGDTLWQAGRQGVFMPPHRREVGLVFQHGHLFPHLDVEGNLRFADKRSRNRSQSPIRLDDVLSALDLAPLLARDVASLSGGERQRVALGRALMARPALLLLDEPVSAIDGKKRTGILTYIERASQQFAVPIIYVTHTIEEVARLAERLIVLSQGRITAEGRAAEIMARLDLYPMTGRFEAGALLLAEVVAHDPTARLTHLDHCGQRLSVPLNDLPPGQRIRLRVRARDVAIATERPRAISTRNILAGRIVQLVSEAETPFAEILVDVGEGVVRARITRQAVDELALEAGIEVFALIKSISLEGSVMSLPVAPSDP